MKSIEIEETVAASIESVFAMFSDFRNAAPRISGIESIEMLTDGPTQVGTAFKETRIMMGRKATETMTVVKFEPPLLYVLDANSCGCHYSTEFLFTSVAGGTQIRMTFCSTAISLIAKIMLVVMKPFMGKLMNVCRTAIQKDIQDLKAVLESSPQEL